MGRNYYSEIHLHVTWHTKESLPLLTPEIESLAHREIRQKAVHTPGVFLHVVGGTETHVHLALTIPPTLAVSELIGQLKGASTHAVNEQVRSRGKVLQWQAGYGAVSFGAAQLDWVRAYISNQREHHAKGLCLNGWSAIAGPSGSPVERG